MLERVIMVMAMVEELDDIRLTNEERIAAAVFFAYASIRTDAIVTDDTIEVMRAL